MTLVTEFNYTFPQRLFFVYFNKRLSAVHFQCLSKSIHSQVMNYIRFYCIVSYWDLLEVNYSKADKQRLPYPPIWRADICTLMVLFTLA